MPLSSKLFVVHNDQKLFTAEVSVLEHADPLLFKRAAPLNRIVEMVSERTGDIARFIYVDTVRNHDDEVLEWNFRVMDETVVRLRHLANYKMRIYND